MDEDRLYSSDDFDPYSLSVPQLRNALLAHDVDYTGVTRKADLVNLFEIAIRQPLRESLGHRGRASSRKTKDASAHSSEIHNGPSRQLAQHDSSRSKVQPNDYFGDVGSTAYEQTKSSRKTATRAKSATSNAVIHGKDAEGEVPPRRNPRRLVQRPSGFVDSPASRFTPTIIDPRQARKRISTSSSVTRLSIGYDDLTILDKEDDVDAAPQVTTSTTSSTTSKSKSKETHGKEPLATKATPSTSSAWSTMKTSFREASQSAKSMLVSRNTFFVLLMILTLLYGVWWRQERLAAGYCDSDLPEVDRQSRAKGNILDYIRPNCMPCPTHAHCSNGKLTHCDSNFLLHSHPLSLGGLLPLPQICVADTEKQQRAEAVASEIKRMLSVRAGDVLCGRIRVDKRMDRNVTTGLQIEDIWDRLVELKDESVTEDQFEEYWKMAFKDLSESSPEIAFVTSSKGEKYLVSKKPTLDVLCKIRLNAISWIWRHLFDIFFFTAVLGGIVYLRSLYNQYNRDKKRARQLAKLVFERLQKQSYNHKFIDPIGYERYMASTHLRDAHISPDINPKQRLELWQKVSTIVERNTNVRASMVEIQGEMHRAWEWIGDLEHAPPNRHPRDHNPTSLYPKVPLWS